MLLRALFLVTGHSIALLLFSFACFWCQSFDDVSPYLYLYYFRSVWVAFWEKAVHLVDQIMYFYFDFSILVISPLVLRACYYLSLVTDFLIITSGVMGG